MDTKILIREFNILNGGKTINEIENSVNQLKMNGYKIVTSNLYSRSQMVQGIYILLEKD